MKTINNKVMVFLTALLMSVSTSAFSFEGFSVGASYSSLDFNTAGTEVAAEAGEDLDSTSTTKTGSGDVPSIFAEYTFAQGSTLGIEYIDGSTEIGKGSRTQTSSEGGDTGTITVKAEISDPLTFYVEPTMMLSDTFGVYVKGGATQVTVDPTEVSDSGGLATSTYKSKDVWGIMTGVGAKFYSGNMFAKLEYTETEYEQYVYQATNGSKNTIFANIDTEETRVSVGYNF